MLQRGPSRCRASLGRAPTCSVTGNLNVKRRFRTIRNIYRILLRTNKRFQTYFYRNHEISTLIALIRAEQLRSLGRNGPVGALSALAAAFVLAGVIYVDAPQNRSSLLSVAWLAVMTAEVAWHISLCYGYQRARSGETRWGYWEPRFVLIAFLEGLTWGLGTVVLSILGGNLDHQLLILLVGTGVAAGSVLAFGSYLPAFYAMFFATAIPFPLWSLMQGDTLHYALALLIMVFIFAIFQLAQSFNSSLIHALRLRFENEALVSDLRSQKNEAELQKEVAERANQAKTRFLAHANHDLRQPIQALNLDAATLKTWLNRVPLDRETFSVIERIDTAAKSLAELLTSLLDLSRLDANLVEVHETSFRIDLLLQPICDEYRPEAEAKGLQLILHDCSAYIRTDRVQLRRIVANLVSNAIRYTDRGRVIVRCRGPRSSETGLHIQVWDTGRGIPVEQQGLVFEEFQQLDNPERDRTKGLGLGLFIVKRLAELLKCDLQLRSKPRRGSVFTITIPLAGEVVAADPPASKIPASSPAHDLILVIDDELSIRESIRNLLNRWGYQVIVAGSGSEMLPLIADLAYHNRPVLIICDYRLRAGEDGIAVIQSLRSEYNDDIPAILLTGDTAPARLKAASESGVVVLHKPIDEGALHGAICGLLCAAASFASE
jgi:signal transduction histidine kinase/CheY-like chemotaxis protein